MEEIRNLYIKTYGTEPVRIEKLTASASPRSYFRVYGGSGTVIATAGTSASENEAFIYLSRHLGSKGLPTPEIISVSEDGMTYLQEDLGDTSLWDAVAEGRKKSGSYSDREISLLERAMSDLADFQFRGAEGMDWSRCYQQMVFDRRSVLFDLNYFKYCFLKPSGIEYDENILEDEFGKMADILTSEPSDSFLYRDFQPRNIMLHDDRLIYIDYQGGRRGPKYYDVASFIWQAAAVYPDSLRGALIETYLKSLAKYEEVDEAHFRNVLQHFVLFRTLQVLAAYGFRGLYEGKVRFQMSIPSALANLTSLFSDGNLFCRALTEYPCLAGLAARLSRSFKPHQSGSDPYGRDADPGLLIEVYSFSYMQGIPREAYGNGGGYVFDCRGMENPGRELRFRHSTGLDADVIGWLEERGEIQQFLSSAYSLADAHIECYIRRGFSHLMLCFGCTGGQHRSVYCAQHMAEHIAEKFAGQDVRIRLIHRERGVSQEIVPKPFEPGPCLILAAGFGTRLRPLTDYVPKALAPVGGRPLICSLMDRLYSSGWRQVTVNLHHGADMLEEYVRFTLRDSWRGLKVLFSDERGKLLDTGGAVKKVLEEQSVDSPLLVHNVDIVSDLSLKEIYQSACDALDSSGNALAALAVSDRDSSRKLFFDRSGRLRGWKNLKTGEERGTVTGELKGLAFSGIYVISPKAAEQMRRYPDAFSIIDFFLEVCQYHDIIAVETPSGRVKDIGKY